MIVAGLACSAIVPAAAGSEFSVQYTISLANPAQHLVNVRIAIPPGAPGHDLQLPVWNAVYQVRDFSQYVNWVRAKGASGQPLAVRKVDKSRWQISGTEDGAEVEYEIVADVPGPFGAQLNAQHAFFNFAEILMYPVDARAAQVKIRFTNVPNSWKTAIPLANAGPQEFTAENYDRLVDAPAEIGPWREEDFDEGGGHYRVVVDADSSDYDLKKIIVTLRAIVASATSWMNDRPCETYLFLYHFPREFGGGGMEHACSTAIELNATRVTGNSSTLADVTAHEFFHLWNVKRIRPQSLEPVDYTKENYTTALWFSEGVTTTAANAIRFRAGLLDEAHMLKGLADQIEELEQDPAHSAQSAEESSLDAWLEKYDYYRLPGRSISYYTKGCLLGVLLDLALRESSHGSASLREVLQWMNRNAQQGKFFADSLGVRQAAETVGHTDLGWFFQKYVAGTDEIPWDDFFKTVGLHLVRQTVAVANPGFLATRNFDAAPSIGSVAPDSEAERAGLRVGDAVLELNGHMPAADVERELEQLRPGSTLHLRVRRGHSERELHWKLAGLEEVEFDLKDVDNITPQQRARRTAWLKGEAEGESPR